ncbi:AP-1 complex subunit mu-2-like, partial [Neopelma chrysocephalum]|uniref:AP-1 complex subunit mu-2-like n=1 Tax=Neopelma chrysocephalum TaxID=114329 RepID=UPI000FCD2768
VVGASAGRVVGVGVGVSSSAAAAALAVAVALLLALPGAVAAVLALPVGLLALVGRVAGAVGGLLAPAVLLLLAAVFGRRRRRVPVAGLPLISRNYKGDVGLGEIEHFMGVLLQREEEGTLTPLLTHGHVHFLWIKHANLYLVATTKKNGNASLVYSFLYKVVEVFCEYFKELEEESIRDNFVIVYELLDELMDFGFPQTTDSKILQEYITQEGNKLDTGKSRVPTTVTNAVSWRSEGIRYKKNEVFIDVIESVNLLVRGAWGEGG